MRNLNRISRMKQDDPIEELLHSLKPGPLPDELKRMKEPKVASPTKPIWRSRTWLAAAAAAMVALPGLAWVLQNAGSDGEKQVSILQMDSELLSSKTLATREHAGQLWNIVEEEWRDETVMLFSMTPVRVRSTEIRREIVCKPVQFH
ncbi:MAG: hypothetical protein AAF585_10065 [Verrucomicrobiota bacterium]